MRHTIGGVRAWPQLGCLHASAGTLFDHAGIDPVEALGAGWDFHYTLGDARREEYYFPVRPGQSTLEAMAPFTGARSAWRQPADAESAWSELRSEILADRPMLVAVDNYHLPFRPAYRDVHTNHMLVAYGFDEERNRVRVLDAVPPFFDGEIAIEELDAARGSTNRREHDRDKYFTDNPIAYRWLSVDIPPVALRSERPSIRDVLRTNAARLTEHVDGAYAGIEGQCRFLRTMVGRLEAGESVGPELFIVAGVCCAKAAAHSSWLTAVGQRLGQEDLAELGRSFKELEHHWNALRALLGARSVEAARQLRLRERGLQQANERALAEYLECANGLSKD